MAHTAVNPPAAAERVPVAMSSLYSCPGSRRWVCRSMSPGMTHCPRTSTIRTLAPTRAEIPGATSATTPSFNRTSASASKLRRGSRTRPPRRHRSICRVPLLGVYRPSVNRFQSLRPGRGPPAVRDPIDKLPEALEPDQLVLEPGEAGVEPAGVGDHEDARSGDGLALGAGTGSGRRAEVRPIEADADQRHDGRPPGGDLALQHDVASGELGPRELGGRTGHARAQVGERDAELRQPLVL